MPNELKRRIAEARVVIPRIGILGLICLLTLPSAGYGQEEPAPFQPIAYRSILQAVGLEEEFKALGRKDIILTPPLFRYRLALSTNGKIRRLSRHHRRALEAWSKANSRPDALAIFIHEARVSEGKQSFWLPWQEALVQPFRKELAKGGRLDVDVVFVGAVRGEILLISINYSSPTAELPAD